MQVLVDSGLASLSPVFQTLRKSRRSGGISKESHSDKRGNLKSRISEEPFVVSLIHDNKKDRSEISEPFPRTCNWILEDGRYTTWKDPETGPSMLHVFGNAGCGKSVLAKHILAALDDDSDVQRSRRVDVLYYFCNNRKRNNETASLIVLSMICQLLTRNADLVDDISKRVGVQNLRSWARNPHKLSFDSLWAIFSSAIYCSGYDIVYCVIDGLDECENESSRHLFSRLYTMLDVGANVTAPKFLVTSRPRVYKLENHLPCLPTIRIDSATTQDDIAVYVQNEVWKLQEEFGLEIKDLNGLEEYLVSNAEGMFLWVDLALEEARKDLRHKEIITHGLIQCLPTGLDALYERVLNDIHHSHGSRVGVVQKILTWIVLAARPLTLAEVRVALAVSSNDETPISLQAVRNVSAELRALCSSFIEIVPPDNGSDQFKQSNITNKIPGDDDNEDLGSTVRLIHQSAKDYLIALNCLHNSYSIFGVDPQIGHAQVAQVCLTYLLRKEFSAGPVKLEGTDTSRSSNPELKEALNKKLAGNDLLRYATLYWSYHVREASKENGGHDVINLACQFLTEAPAQLESWYQLSFYLRRSRTDYDARNTDSTLVAFLGLPEVLKKLLNLKKVDVDGALCCALQNEDEELCSRMVDTLLQHGARIEGKDHNLATTLQHAVIGGHRSVIDRLNLLSRTDINSKDINGRTPLCEAAFEGNESMVNLLSAQADIDLNPFTKYGHSPLCCSTDKGRIGILKSLLAHGADPEFEGNNGQTALFCAVQFGTEEAVKMLLDQDFVDPNHRDKDGLTPLSQVFCNWRNGVAELLLNKGANPRSLNNDGGTLLFSAVEGQVEGVQFLLDNGVDLNVQDNLGVTALHLAVALRKRPIVELFLQQEGIDVNLKESTGRTALIYAAEGGDDLLIQLLLGHMSVDLNAMDNSGQTPLLKAARYGHETVVEILLEREDININSSDHDGRTPLFYAAKNRHEKVVELLQKKLAERHMEEGGAIPSVLISVSAPSMSSLRLSGPGFKNTLPSGCGVDILNRKITASPHAGENTTDPIATEDLELVLNKEEASQQDLERPRAVEASVLAMYEPRFYPNSQDRNNIQDPMSSTTPATFDITKMSGLSISDVGSDSERHILRSSCDFDSRDSEQSSISDLESLDIEPAALLRSKKKSIIDFVMQWFVGWLDKNLDHLVSSCGDGSVSVSQGASASNGKQKDGCNNRKRARERKCEENDSDNDSSEENIGGRPKKNIKTEHAEFRRLACPFYKHNRPLFQRWRVCCGPGFDNFHHVKQHIIRKHRPPRYRCDRCYKDLGDEARYISHLRCAEQCQLCPQPIAEGFISDDAVAQLKQLASRTRGASDPQKWTEMYKVLFPDDDHQNTPSPFHEDVNIEEDIDSANYLRSYSRFVRMEMPSIFRRELDSIVTDELEERLRTRIVEAVQRLNSQLYIRFQEIHGLPMTSGIDATLFSPQETSTTLQLEQQEPADLINSSVPPTIEGLQATVEPGVSESTLCSKLQSPSEFVAAAVTTVRSASAVKSTELPLPSHLGPPDLFLNLEDGWFDDPSFTDIEIALERVRSLQADADILDTISITASYMS